MSVYCKTLTRSEQHFRYPNIYGRGSQTSVVATPLEKFAGLATQQQI